MRKKTRKSKKKFIVMFIFFIIALVIVMYMVRKNRVLPYTDTVYDNTLVQTAPIYENEEKKKIYPENAYQFIKNYQKFGKANLNKIYDELYSLKESIYLIRNENKNKSDEQIKKYYEENKNVKFKNIKFSNTDSFLRLVKETAFLDNDLIKLEKSKFDIDTFDSSTEGVVICDLYYIFSQDNSIVFDCMVSKEKEEIIFVYK